MVFKVLEASANNIWLRNKLLMRFIDMRQVDFRAAISESRDLKILGCLALQPIEVPPSPWVGYCEVGKTVQPESSRNACSLLRFTGLVASSRSGVHSAR